MNPGEFNNHRILKKWLEYIDKTREFRMSFHESMVSLVSKNLSSLYQVQSYQFFHEFSARAPIYF